MADVTQTTAEHDDEDDTRGCDVCGAELTLTDDQLRDLADVELACSPGCARQL